MSDVNNDELGLLSVLRARATELAAPEVQDAAVELVDLVVFRAGNVRYAIDAVDVQEAIAITAVTPLPGVPAFYRGLIIHQGVVYPLLDVRLLVGAAADDGFPQQALLFANHERTIAIGADVVESFVRVEAGHKQTEFTVLDVHVLFADARLVVDDR